MKALIFIGLLWTATLRAEEKGFTFPLEVTGVIDLPGLKQVFLEKVLNPRLALIMSEGNSNANVEVISIQPAEGTVKVKVKGGSGPTTLTLKEQTAAAKQDAPGLSLNNANSELVLALYTNFTKKFYLRSPSVSPVPVSVRASASNSIEAQQVIDRALAESGIAMVPAGEKFMLIVGKEQARSIKELVERSTIFDFKKESAVLVRPGEISFRGATVWHALIIYGEYMGRKIDFESVPPNLMAGEIFFQNEIALTKGEVLFVLEALLEMRGIKTIVTGDKTAKAVPITEN